MAKVKRVLRCHKCGKMLQHEDPNLQGYIPTEIYELGERKADSMLYCNDCFAHLKEINSSELNENIDKDIMTILDDAVASDAKIVWIIDLFSFNGTFKKELVKQVKGLDIYVVATKRDLFPANINDKDFEQYIVERFEEVGITPKAVAITGNESESRYKEFVDIINSERKGHDVYLIGAVTSGKTSFINRCLKHYTNHSKRNIRTIVYPGTNSKVLEIPFTNSSFLYELPGISLDTAVTGKVEKDVQRIIVPKKFIQTKSIPVAEGDAIAIGGLAVYIFKNCKPFKVTLYVADEVEFKKMNEQKISEFTAINYHKRTVRPVSDRIKDFKDYDVFEYNMEDDNLKHDVAIEGLGWISFVAKGQTIRVILPKGTALKESLSKVK